MGFETSGLSLIMFPNHVDQITDLCYHFFTLLLVLYTGAVLMKTGKVNRVLWKPTSFIENVNKTKIISTMK